MGTGKRGDRLVAITDAKSVMNLVLFWRDAIPMGWKPIADGRDRRIACERSVRFGDPNIEASASEQSVLVRGYSSVIVQNLLQDESVVDPFPGILKNAAAALYGGDPNLAPRGVERIDWKPKKRTCRSKWTSNASIPNGVPTMSEATQLFYGIGQRDGKWGVESLRFKNGRSRMFAEAPATPCDESVLTELPEVVSPSILPLLEAYPRSCENSFFAATEVGPNRTIYTGTFAGMTIYRTKKKL